MPDSASDVWLLSVFQNTSVASNMTGTKTLPGTMYYVVARKIKTIMVISLCLLFAHFRVGKNCKRSTKHAAWSWMREWLILRMRERFGGKSGVRENCRKGAMFDLEWLKLYFARWSKKGSGSEIIVQAVVWLCDG